MARLTLPRPRVPTSWGRSSTEAQPSPRYSAIRVSPRTGLAVRGSTSTIPAAAVVQTRARKATRHPGRPAPPVKGGAGAEHGGQADHVDEGGQPGPAGAGRQQQRRPGRDRAEEGDLVEPAAQARRVRPRMRDGVI